MRVGLETPLGAVVPTDLPKLPHEGASSGVDA